MGIPIGDSTSLKDAPTSQTTSQSQPSNASTTNTQSTSADSAASPQDPLPSKPSELPPAALDLAAKLFDYARTGDDPSLREYLFAGIPPNLTNHAGDTLLMLAAYHGHVSTVKLLLDKGADTNVVNDRGQSIVAGAVFKGFEEVVRELVARGADVRKGQPSAVDAGRLFKRVGCLRVMGCEEEANEAERSEGPVMPPTMQNGAQDG